MRASIPVFATVLALCCAVPAQRTVPYDKLARQFLTDHGRTESADKVDLNGLLEADYVRMRLGAFDVRFPTARVDRRGLANLKSILVCLLDVQQTLREWRGEKIETKDLAKWIRSWSHAKFRRGIGRVSSRDLVAVLDAPHVIAAAIREFAEVMAKSDREKPFETHKLILCPDRREFVGACCFLGAAAKSNKPSMWVPAVATNVVGWVDAPMPLHVVALQYAHPLQNGDDFTTGVAMNLHEKTGMLQHVAQCGAAALARLWFGDALDPTFEAGLKQNVVIAVCGENNSRSTGDGRGRFAAQKSAFVPGGRSEGGFFAPENLDSLWRATKGKDWFVKPLKRNTKAAAKKIKAKQHRLGAFVLKSGNQSASHLVRGPFLGRAARDQAPVPEAFVDDLAEFYRAYSSCFLHWLQQHGAGKRKASATAFAELLRRIAAEPGALEAACADVYDMPLSGGPGSESLEWRFLTWLR